MIVLAGYKLASGLTGTFVGFALVIASAFAWAVGTIIAKRGAKAHGADMFALTVLVEPCASAAARGARLCVRGRHRHRRICRSDESARLGCSW
jgi:hypothetical protein